MELYLTNEGIDERLNWQFKSRIDILTTYVYKGVVEFKFGSSKAIFQIAKLKLLSIFSRIHVATSLRGFLVSRMLSSLPAVDNLMAFWRLAVAPSWTQPRQLICTCVVVTTIS